MGHAAFGMEAWGRASAHSRARGLGPASLAAGLPAGGRLVPGERPRLLYNDGLVEVRRAA